MVYCPFMCIYYCLVSLSEGLKAQLAELGATLEQTRGELARMQVKTTSKVREMFV